MAPRGRPPKHVCSKCHKSFPSGRALGGHMSRHWRKAKQPKGTPSPPTTVVDLHVSLLSPSDEETLLRSSGTQCQLCSKVSSACDSLRKHMREHSEKNVLSRPVEEAAGPMEALAIAGGGYNVLISPVKRKRSKRGAPPLKFNEMDAAASLLLLSEHSSMISAYADCYAEVMGSWPPNVSKDMKLNASDHLLVRSAEFKKPKGCKCSAYDICYGQCDKDNNLIPSVAKDKTSVPDIPNNSACEDCFGQCETDSSLIPNVSQDKTLIPNIPKNSAYEDCFGQCKKDINLIPNVPKDKTSIPDIPNNSACEDCFEQCETDSSLIPNVAQDKTLIPNIPKNPASEDCFGQCEKDSSLTPNVYKKGRSLIANVPEKDNNTLISIDLEEVELNVLDHVLAGDAELRKKPRTDNSVEMKCADLSAAVKVKRHQCNACGKSFGSGVALGGHMRHHLPRSNDRRHGFAEGPDSVAMKEQKQKLELDTKFLDLRLPGLTDITIFSGLKSEPEPWRVAGSVHWDNAGCALLSELPQSLHFSV
ncbi:uncharacterized protein LOC123395617 [Hordeum vulgare subsp. vulgare]|uniref:C2H2-type domain-containing protein n=1 Tax=Hordeum vulgare subsp. vulgare TaxID=112509 RepID=A0A8I6YNW4_HORVV|nr:uncharacterized protein LOC123395617 [Hordeum vulgare subsp. vulgare]